MVKFESGFGTLQFDSDYLEFDVDNQVAFEKSLPPTLKLGLGLFTKAISGALPKRSTGKIRIEQINDVRFSVYDKGSKLANATIRPNAGAAIVILTSSGGSYLYVERGKESEAQEFINLLQASILNRGKEVEAIEVTEEETKICPDCAEKVKAAARKCRFCDFQFE